VGLQKTAPQPFLKVIVDTCVWSLFLRRNRPVADPVAKEVERLVRSDAVQLLGPIRQELLSGAQSDDRFEQLKEYLRFYPNLALNEEDDETAASFYTRLRRRGLQGTGTDLLICAVTIRHGFKLFTTDNDFSGYAKYIPLKLHQPRGIPFQ
jgi:hypothetical protein